MHPPSSYVPVLQAKVKIINPSNHQKVILCTVHIIYNK